METVTFTRQESDARHRFDDWSESTTFQRLRPWLSYVQSRVLERIDWDKSSRVLDVACGSGWAVYQAARQLKDKKNGMACGCDISEGMLEQRGNENHSDGAAYFLAASAQALPYASDRFDAVICTAAFHHFPIPNHALVEFRRILRPGGIVLIADTCRNQSLGIWVWDRLHRWFEKGHIQYYRTDELLGLLDGAGFRDARVTELKPSYAQTRKLVRKAALFSAIAP